MKHKLLSIILSLSLVFSLLPTAALAETTGSCPSGGESCTHQAAIGDTHYVTLKEAIDAADNNTVTLLHNVTLTAMQTISGKTFTLDLNDHKINATLTALKLDGSTNMTVRDSSVAASGGLYSEYTGIIVESGSTLTVTSGTIKGDVNAVLNHGTVNIKDTAKLQRNTGHSVECKSNSTTNMTGGTAFDIGTTENDYGYTVNVSGGVVENYVYATSVTGGTIKDLILINGNEVKEATINGSIRWLDNTVPTLNNVTIGESATVKNAGYHFNTDKTAIEEIPYEAVLNSTYYEDVDEALTYWAANGGTLKLLVDCTTDAGASGSWYFNVQKTATLDLNGKTLTLGANKYIGTPYDENNPQTLTIQDSGEGGKLVGAYFYVIQGSWSTTVIVNGGEIANTNNRGALLNNGPVVVNGGKLTGGTYGVSTNSDFTMTKGEINILTLNARVAKADLGTTDGVYTDVKIGTLTVGSDSTTVNFNSGIIDTFSTSFAPTLNATGNAYFVNEFTNGLPAGKMLNAVQKDGNSYYQIAELTEADAAAKVTTADGTETLYADASAAASALKAGGTLTLLKNHTSDTLRVNKDVTGSVTIDLNGKTVTNSNGPALYVVINGDSSATEPYTVNVTGGGVLESADSVALRVSSVNNAADVAVDDSVTLTAGGKNAPIDLQNNARLVYTDEAVAKARIFTGYTVTVNGKNYAFGISGGLDDAIDMLPDEGGTVKLLGDYGGSLQIKFGRKHDNKPVVLDLNSNTFDCTYATGTAALLLDRPNLNLTVKNGTIISAAEYAAYGYLDNRGADFSGYNLKLTLDNVTLKATNGNGFGVNGTLTGNITLIKNSTIEAADTGIYYPTQGTLTIENSKITGEKLGVAVKGGTVNISGDGTEIKANAEAKEPANYYGGGTGNIEAEGYALYVEGGYDHNITLNISGGTFISKGDAIYKFVKDDDTAATRTIAVSGGQFSSAVDSEYCADGFVPKTNSDSTYGVTRPSSGSSDPTYSVSTPSKTENGTVTVSPKSASKGDTVTVTVKPDSGYVLGSLTVTDSKGNELTLTDKGDGKYTFTMPAGKVEVKASFAKEVETSPFADVTTDAYYYEAVKWAVKNGITDGVGNDLFAPGQPCTRAQIVTFLWRAAGSPEPKGTAAGMTDVVSGSYYEKAVAWAIENGVTTGTTATTFSPDATCTRAQAVTFLARALNAKAASAAEFSDVPTDSYFAEAVAWAAANGVTEGVGNGMFAPDNDCTRGQIVTFLYRAYNK